MKNFYDVVVIMDRDDYALEQLVEDLLSWTEHLYEVPLKKKSTEVMYRGFCPVKEVKHLELLQAASPYGNGYTILIDGKNNLFVNV